MCACVRMHVCVEKERGSKYGKMSKIVNLSKGYMGILCSSLVNFL